ncbi:hypothetical protein DUI87_17859 [Hirundo rustica rustica]|uniref:Uncharacterized protein n=1 Tax=Hirundo rustica rustica TaxID=333673 RepID=A0A3M0JV33_HIRRU|nr:hypothetical protein DUI87_17859 [Hirundo rustica rustica]
MRLFVLRSSPTFLQVNQVFEASIPVHLCSPGPLGTAPPAKHNLLQVMDCKGCALLCWREHRIVESPELDGVQKVESSSWPCPGHSSNLTLRIPGSIIRMFLELWQPWDWAHSLGSLGSAQHPLGEEPFPEI